MTADLSAPDSAALEAYQASGSGWWPQGDPVRLRTAAAAWFLAATTLDAIADYGRRLAWEVRGRNSGDAVDAFTGFWARTEAHLGIAAAGARALGRASADYAQAVDRARIEIGALRSAGTVAAIEMVEAALVETVLAIVASAALSATAGAAHATGEDFLARRLQSAGTCPLAEPADT